MVKVGPYVNSPTLRKNHSRNPQIFTPQRRAEFMYVENVFFFLHF